MTFTIRQHLRPCSQAGAPLINTDDKTLLFVYGTLRQGFPGAMARWLQRKGRYLGTGWCRGQLFDRGAYPVMAAPKRGEEIVHGDLYLLENAEAILARLDRYEGCSRSARPPGEYYRTRLAVTLDGGSVLQAWAYIYRYPTRGLRRITDGDYLRYRFR